MRGGRQRIGITWTKEKRTLHFDFGLWVKMKDVPKELVRKLAPQNLACLQGKLGHPR
jgi:hypothetical protein